MCSKWKTDSGKWSSVTLSNYVKWQLLLYMFVCLKLRQRDCYRHSCVSQRHRYTVPNQHKIISSFCCNYESISDCPARLVNLSRALSEVRGCVNAYLLRKTWCSRWNQNIVAENCLLHIVWISSAVVFRTLKGFTHILFDLRWIFPDRAWRSSCLLHYVCKLCGRISTKYHGFYRANGTWQIVCHRWLCVQLEQVTSAWRIPHKRPCLCLLTSVHIIMHI